MPGVLQKKQIRPVPFRPQPTPRVLQKSPTTSRATPIQTKRVASTATPNQNPKLAASGVPRFRIGPGVHRNSSVLQRNEWKYSKQKTWVLVKDEKQGKYPLPKLPSAGFEENDIFDDIKGELAYSRMVDPPHTDKSKKKAPAERVKYTKTAKQLGISPSGSTPKQYPLPTNNAEAASAAPASAAAVVEAPKPKTNKEILAELALQTYATKLTAKNTNFQVRVDAEVEAEGHYVGLNGTVSSGVQKAESKRKGRHAEQVMIEAFLPKFKNLKGLKTDHDELYKNDKLTTSAAALAKQLEAKPRLEFHVSDEPCGTRCKKIFQGLRNTFGKDIPIVIYAIRLYEVQATDEKKATVSLTGQSAWPIYYIDPGGTFKDDKVSWRV